MDEHIGQQYERAITAVVGILIGLLGASIIGALIGAGIALLYEVLLGYSVHVLAASLTGAIVAATGSPNLWFRWAEFASQLLSDYHE
jgi:hypothetical protein